MTEKNDGLSNQGASETDSDPVPRRERAASDKKIALTSGETSSETGTGFSEGDTELKRTTEPGEVTDDAAEERPETTAPPSEESRRTFRVEGPDGAIRITYDDLDLLKLLQMDPVTPDCVEKMPAWMRELDGKQVRLRGFMKPDFIATGIRRFLLVKDTGLCCFGPAGKIYDLIQVTLQKGSTTDYIELRPFDVVGTFRIHLEILEDEGLIHELFHIDNAKIIQK